MLQCCNVAALLHFYNSEPKNPAKVIFAQMKEAYKRMSKAQLKEKYIENAKKMQK
jgi:curved DNA-binding protein CbpA